MDSNKPSTIKALIVDDELHARENLRFLLGEHGPDIQVVATAENVEAAYNAFIKTRPELIFLDIRMPSGAEGFDLLDRLAGHDFHVVFVTAFKEYAIRAFENRALHYILKPIDEDDLRETLDRVRERRSVKAHSEQGALEYRHALHNLREAMAERHKPEKLSITHSKGIKIIDLDDIEYLESEGNCTVLHFRDGGSYLDTRTLKVYEAMLPDRFFRLHRSFMVNLHCVTELLHGDDRQVILKSGKKLPIARERRGDLIQKIKVMTGADSKMSPPTQ